MARIYSSSKCSSASKVSSSPKGNCLEMSRITLLASSKFSPKNSRHKVCLTGYFGWRINVRCVMIPSVPSFCSPGTPINALLVISFQRPFFLTSVPLSSMVSRVRPFSFSILKYEKPLVLTEEVA